MILLKLIFVCLLVIPFFYLCMFLVRYTSSILRASNKSDKIKAEQKKKEDMLYNRSRGSNRRMY